MITKQQLTDVLKSNFGFDHFKGNQEQIMMSLLEGKDVFVLMPTGGGKSLCYQLPSLLMEGTAIVVSPLIALMKNQVDAMRNFSTDDGILPAVHAEADGKLFQSEGIVQVHGRRVPRLLGWAGLCLTGTARQV